MAKEDEVGLGVVFAVAEDEGNCKPFAGLSLLSQVCVEEEIPGTHMITAVDAIPACRRVGLRKPCNEEREKIVLMDSIAGHSQRSVYIYYCKEYKTKPNSVLFKSLADNPGDFSATEIDCTGNFIGDKGLLPLLEVVRLCSQCTSLILPENGVKNSGVECIVHVALEHPSLRDLNLANNRITLGAGKVLQELATRNPAIRSIVLDGTRIDEQLQARIHAKVQDNAQKGR